MKAPIILSILIYIFSLWLLIIRRKKGGKVGLLFLMLLHGVIGLGYIFMGFYIGFKVGELFSPLLIGNISDMTYWSLAVISVFLLALNQVWYLLDSNSSFSHQTKFYFKSKRVFIIILFLIPVYFAGLQFNTLGVGLNLNYVLPFRLNGIIEAITLFLLPFFLAILFNGSERGFWFGFCIMGSYAMINLIFFGSKFAAIFPIIAFALTHFLVGKNLIRKLVIPVFGLLLLYTVLNPYYFRTVLASGIKPSFTSSITESFKQANRARETGGINFLGGVRNAAQRVVGLEMMGVAIKIVQMLPDPHLDATKYLNIYLNSPEDNNAAPGHFGYFIIATGSTVWGLGFGFIVLGLILIITIRFDQLFLESGRVKYFLLGLVFVINTLGWLIDGNYSQSGNYLQLLFNMLVVYFLSSWFIEDKNQVSNIKNSHKVLQ